MSDRNSDLSGNAGLGSRNQTDPATLDMEREPMPDSAPEADSDADDAPPARSGQASAAVRKPTEAAGKDNPVHHTGHIPSPVTANKD